MMIMNRMVLSPLDWKDSFNGRLATTEIDTASEEFSERTNNPWERLARDDGYTGNNAVTDRSLSRASPAPTGSCDDREGG
jgi:hypothetical protein